MLVKRQEGRETDQSIWNIMADKKEINEILKKGELVEWESPNNEYLYGVGDSCDRIKDIIIEKFF